MNALDWIVLLGTMLGIAAYGTWRTRHTDNLNTYLKGSSSTRWGTIGISVMATQASTITYLSFPGQAYENGIAFIQNYFGLPLALILVCAVFLPIYRKLGVYTAYEYLGKRFDQKTRLLGAGLFLLQRGIQAGITIYAPSIILATVLHWRLDLTIIFTGLLAIIYTVTGGSAAVNLTQKWQMGGDFRRHDHGVRRLAGETSAGCHAHCGSDGQTAGRRLHSRPQAALHLVERTAGRIFPFAVVLRHRPVAGAAIHRRRSAARRPAWADVQRAASKSRCSSSS